MQKAIKKVTPNLNTTELAIGGKCGGQFSNVWLDMVLIFDSTTAVGRDGFSRIKAQMSGYVRQLSISTGSGRHTRLGLVNLGSVAQVVASLDHFHSTNDATTALDGMSYLGDTTINHEEGLLKARDLFETAQKRDNVKKLVVLLTAHQVDCPEIITEGAESACRAAASLKDIATLLTVSLGNHDTPTPPLYSLATPCFAATNRDLNFEDLLLSVNCFCEGQRWLQFQDGCVRHNDCVYLHESTTDFESAQHHCSLQHRRLAYIGDAQKNSFVNDIASRYNVQSFWIALEITTSYWGRWDQAGFVNIASRYNVESFWIGLEMTTPYWRRWDQTGFFYYNSLYNYNNFHVISE
uniref:VWFA domain-containing protein n=1 Tax=Steinernema glaseri TaxID=37863 RepID=A0A1I7YG48_9BILA